MTVKLPTVLGLEAFVMRGTIGLIWGLVASLYVRAVLAALIGAGVFYLLLLIRPRPQGQ